MGKFFRVAAILVLALTIGSMTASAQTQISLGPTASGSIAFIGNSGNVTINLGTLNGLSAFFPAGPDSYTIVQSGSITLASNGAITQANPLSFSYNNGVGGTLTGNLRLINFAQAGSLGLFNDNLVANLTNLGGTLASSFGSAASGDITIRVQSGASVFNLFTSNGTVFANISTGEIVPTPESSTFVLFGTGLLAVGILLWRRTGAPSHQAAAI